MASRSSVAKAVEQLDALDTHPEKTIREAGKKAPKAREVHLDEVEIDKLGEEYGTEVETEISGREGREQDWIRYLKLYDSQPRMTQKNYPFEGASNVVVPFAAIYCDTIEARIMQSIFSLTPHWSATELSRKAADLTKPTETYFDWIRKHQWNQETVVESLVKQTLKLGTSCLYNGFVDETPKRYVTVPGEKGTFKGMTIERARKFGPRPEWVSLDDTVMPQGYLDEQTSPYFGHCTWFSGDRLRQLADAEYLEEVDKVLRAGPDEETDLRRLRRSTAAKNDLEISRAERFGLFRIWNIWFSRDLDGDGFPEEWVMMLHGESRTVLRLQQNPYPSQMRPYVITRYIAREGDWYGVGIPERIEQLQEEASTIHNQRRDRAHLANIVMYVSEMGNVGVGNTIRPISGKVIKVLNVNSLKEFGPSNAVQVDAFEEQFVTQLADRAVGQSELGEGKVTSPIGRAAATTVMSMLQEGARRFDRVISRMRSALGLQAHQIGELIQTFGLPEPGAFGSPEEVLDKQPAAIVRKVLGSQDDLRLLMAIDLSVSTQAINRETEKQSNIQLYGMVGQYVMQILQLATGAVNPQMPPALGEVIVRLLKGVDLAMTRVLQSHNAFDLEDVLVAEIFEQYRQAMQQQPQQGTGGPQGAAGGGGGPGQAPGQASPAPLGLPGPGGNGAFGGRA